MKNFDLFGYPINFNFGRHGEVGDSQVHKTLFGTIMSLIYLLACGYVIQYVVNQDYKIKKQIEMVYPDSENYILDESTVDSLDLSQMSLMGMFFIESISIIQGQSKPFDTLDDIKKYIDIKIVYVTKDKETQSVSPMECADFGGNK